MKRKLCVLRAVGWKEGEVQEQESDLLNGRSD